MLGWKKATTSAANPWARKSASSREPSRPSGGWSRRFIPTVEQAHRSALLAAMHAMGASEAEVIEKLHEVGQRYMADILRLKENMPLDTSFTREKP